MSSVVAISISFIALFILFSALSRSVFTALTHSLVFASLIVLNFLYFLKPFFNVYFLFVLEAQVLRVLHVLTILNCILGLLYSSFHFEFSWLITVLFLDCFLFFHFLFVSSY